MMAHTRMETKTPAMTNRRKGSIEVENDADRYPCDDDVSDENVQSYLDSLDIH